MLNKLVAFVHRNRMLQPGDHVVCAVSGGADSVALLFAMYLLRDKLGITISAAHFNHRLRADESDRDEAFVRNFCSRYDIPLTVGSSSVVPGKKGLEAAARDARYGFLKNLPGKIATAHTADDNAETMVMHLIRGTGLKGLGAIAPINGNLIRPMLDVTRKDVLSFLSEYNLAYVTDSSNDTDQFLRNRIRHHIMPLFRQENPKIAENLSALALRLRQDEEALCNFATTDELPNVSQLREISPAIRSRQISAFLQKCGVPEPEAAHIALVEQLIFSDRPSARAFLPGGVLVARNYDSLERCDIQEPLKKISLNCPGTVTVSELGLRIVCKPASCFMDTPECFTVTPRGQMVVRCRQAGDRMQLSGGSKEVKKLFIDRKIPQNQRFCIPVIADEEGVLGVFGFGANKDRLADGVSAVEIRYEHI